jgi:hypothetical protein
MTKTLLTLPSGKTIDCNDVSLFNPNSKDQTLELSLRGNPNPFILEGDDMPAFLNAMAGKGIDVSAARKALNIEPPPAAPPPEHWNVPKSSVDTLESYDTSN